MRIALAIAALSLAVPINFSSEVVSPVDWRLGSEPGLRLASVSAAVPLELEVSAIAPKLEISAAAPELVPAPVQPITIPTPTPVTIDLADLREPEGPPPPPPNVAIESVCHTLASAAQEHGLPTGFFARLIWQESKFDQRAVSHAGAQGVAQFMPAVAAERGLLNPFDPLSALPQSARFLKQHLEYFGNLGLAAAAYNAGARRVTDWLSRRGKLPDETRNYVKSITGHPAEKWTQTSQLDLAVDLPRRAPCDGVADLSRTAEAEKVAVQLEAPVAKMIEEARAAEARAIAAKAAAETKRLAAKAEAAAKRLASKKSKREQLMAKAKSGKDKPPKQQAKIADRPTDKQASKAAAKGVKVVEAVARR